MKVLDDEELEACRPEDLIARYKELRDAMAKKDRSTILRMAGNIAGGGVFAVAFNPPSLAKNAVALARAILAEVDQ